MWCIQAFLFPETNGDLTRATVEDPRSALHQMFGGVIRNEGANPTGRSHGPAGFADLVDIRISERKLSFIQHHHHGEIIHYRFCKSTDNEWLGTFQASGLDHGTARCLLTLIPDNFFRPPSNRILLLAHEDMEVAVS